MAVVGADAEAAAEADATTTCAAPLCHSITEGTADSGCAPPQAPLAESCAAEPGAPWEATFQRYCHKRALLAAQGKRQGTAVATAAPPHLWHHTAPNLPADGELSAPGTAAAAASDALCDLCLCWRLADALRRGNPLLFAQQEAFSSTFLGAPSLAPIAFSPTKGGDLCCTPAGVAWLVAEACGARGAVVASTGVHSAAALEGSFVRAAAAAEEACSRGEPRRPCLLIVGKCRDDCPLAATHGAAVDAGGEPALARSLDHWFVVTDLAERRGEADSAGPRRFSGLVWNFTGNGGASFPLGAPRGVPAAEWREELCITHVIFARRPPCTSHLR